MMEAIDILDLAIVISLEGPEVILKDIQFLPPLRYKAASHLFKHSSYAMVTSRTCIQHGIIRVSADGGGKKWHVFHDCTFRLSAESLMTNPMTKKTGMTLHTKAKQPACHLQGL